MATVALEMPIALALSALGCSCCSIVFFNPNTNSGNVEAIPNSSTSLFRRSKGYNNRASSLAGPPIGRNKLVGVADRVKAFIKGLNFVDNKL